MKSAALLLILVVAACSDSGTPTSEEQRQLDEAERLLDDAQANLEGIDDRDLAPNEATAQPR